MTVFELMENNKATFTKNDSIIYDNVLKYPNEFISAPIGALATFMNVSHTSITRFIQKLGFANLNEFRYQLSRDLNNQDSDRTTLAQYLGNVLMETEKALTEEILNDLADQMSSHEIISLVGFNLSKVPASHLDYTIKATGKYRTRVLDFESLPYMSSNKDMIIIYSANSGKAFVNWISKITQDESRPYIVLVTLNPRHILRKHVDKVIVLPVVNTALMSDAVYAQQMSFMLFNFMLNNHL